MPVWLSLHGIRKDAILYSISGLNISNVRSTIYTFKGVGTRHCQNLGGTAPTAVTSHGCTILSSVTLASNITVILLWLHSGVCLQGKRRALSWSEISAKDYSAYTKSSMTSDGPIPTNMPHCYDLLQTHCFTFIANGSRGECSLNRRVCCGASAEQEVPPGW